MTRVSCVRPGGVLGVRGVTRRGAMKSGGLGGSSGSGQLAGRCEEGRASFRQQEEEGAGSSVRGRGGSADKEVRLLFHPLAADCKGKGWHSGHHVGP